MNRPRGYEFATTEAICPHVRAAMNRVAKTQQWPITLIGGVGTGKTSAAACMFGAFRRRPMWHRADDLLLSIAMGRVSGIEIEQLNEWGELRRTSIPFSRFVSRVDGASCVFVDDLGTRSPTEAMYQALFDLLEWRKNKPLVITTNKGLGAIAALYDDRIASRLRAGTVIVMNGTDRRTGGTLVRAANNGGQNAD